MSRGYLGNTLIRGFSTEGEHGMHQRSCRLTKTRGAARFTQVQGPRKIAAAPSLLSIAGGRPGGPVPKAERATPATRQGASNLGKTGASVEVASRRKNGGSGSARGHKDANLGRENGRMSRTRPCRRRPSHGRSPTTSSGDGKGRRCWRRAFFWLGGGGLRNRLRATRKARVSQEVFFSFSNKHDMRIDQDKLDRAAR
ncbi:hypothetical protein BRADI_2g34154v3 [Brachypodium distachyon]|uniref:Uncharacterized protein n=1 Tax=Brachypodium distachyon TaxID=15368 RepID=A0A2K2DBP0_BRADI|nr:hypothetical protein BRADI_2g34154v3 [Brachypodium distachyon]